MIARTRLAAGLAAALCLAATACSSGGSASSPSYGSAPSSTPTMAASTPAAPAPAAAATLTLSIADSNLGKILVDGTGKTLYMFTKDTPNTSNCAGQCLAAWPALLGKPTAGSGVDGAKLGSFTRPDGSTQASYNGWPLYYWKGDSKAGDTTGQKVNDVWFVLDRDGKPIKG
ncbi:MAG: hypothetical protein QM711_06180 [Micropruina sp.]|uniref:COG4315 family predicted lipoprotein n=1 Tax=Micropruina sp. TaxID=2737536 RepID=UPI0039E6FF50